MVRVGNLMSLDLAYTRFPVLTTNRLRLRQIQQSDAEALFGVKSDQEVTRCYRQEPHRSLGDTLAWIQQLQVSYDHSECIFWCITLVGEDLVIGSCTFWNFSSDLRRAEVGYELHRGYWRRGIIAEVVSAILSYGFAELGFPSCRSKPVGGK